MTRGAGWGGGVGGGRALGVVVVVLSSNKEYARMRPCGIVSDTLHYRFQPLIFSGCLTRSFGLGPIRGSANHAGRSANHAETEFCSGKLYRARSRLYRNEILQENMRLKALAEIYTMHSFAEL